MCGMQRTTVSPSSSSTRRSTPCVAGCCGPMLISMCSPSSSGSSAGGASIGTTIARLVRRRAGRAAAVPARRARSSRARLRPCVSSSPSLLSHLLAAAQGAAACPRQVLERIGDRQLFHRVPRLGIRRERLTQLLGAAEAAAQRESPSAADILPCTAPTSGCGADRDGPSKRMPNMS